MRKLYALLVLIAFFAISCSSGKEAKKEESIYTPKKVNVKISMVTKKKIADMDTFSGTVFSDTTTFLMPKVVGYVEKIYVQEGETFKKGDLLIKLKSKELEDKKRFAFASVKEADNGLKQAELGIEMAKRQYEQAKAGFELAEKTYKRFQNLLKNESVSQQEFDEVEAKYKMAKASLELAEKNLNLAKEKYEQVKIKREQALAALSEVNTYLSYTEIKAPFDGIVLEKKTDIGNLAAPGAPLLKIGSKKTVVYAFVNEGVLNKIKVGDNVNVFIPAINKGYGAKVLEISPDVDPATRNFKIKLTGCDACVPGMYAKVQVKGDMDDVIVVPENAVVKRGQLEIVFVDKNGKAELRIVKTGRKFEDGIEILSGLKPGERIVIENADKLNAGDILEG
ncbi:acriflavin resistance protein, AcrA/AcrE family [Deferribacter desulfuricans SSM1]|uniref:Acriflavin resistance protein, AcrA/AcrE family n=1 Tax=Deferribacter desulfuricans (strain DSM 14783 / JCM 11476 / NBRC 101012 / SSM1) TaxID=639282 RepID=D3PAE3_DEFDS|nr:efflux RND transporter periplasmic adaptor subunit [Deferribacter desulfuricans]BAI79566.1 acriflavin resistance protein, AcrA/AcrE family [Deferribacter desulfuricans SSM1]